MSRRDLEVAVIGFGGCGHNTINFFKSFKPENIVFVQVDDDDEILAGSHADIKIRPEECGEKLAALLPRLRLFFLAGGLGGSSCRVMPQAARALKGAGALGAALLASPFKFEGRGEKAERDLAKVKEELETVCLFPNSAYSKDPDSLDDMAAFLAGQAEGMWLCVDAMTNKRKDPDKYDPADLEAMITGGGALKS